MITRSKTLNSIPDEKFHLMLQQTIENCNVCKDKEGATLSGGICQVCQIKNRALMIYYESNIPVRYWNLEMERDFEGSPSLLATYREVAANLKDTYLKGINLCLAGKHGLGKTMTVCNILKRAGEAGYSALYTNLSDIVNLVAARADEDRQIGRKELLMVDFLVIDEFDPRYLQSDKAADLFGKSLEEVFRTRTQNALPTFMCSNAADPAEGFSGSIKQSIDSLMGMVKVIPIVGKDFRRKGKVKVDG